MIVKVTMIPRRHPHFLYVSILLKGSHLRKNHNILTRIIKSSKVQVYAITRGRCFSVGISQKTVFNWVSDIPYLTIQGIILFIVSYAIYSMQFTYYYWFFATFLPFSALLFFAIVLFLGVVNMVTTEFLWSMKTSSKGENWLFQGLLIMVPTQLLIFPFPFLLGEIAKIGNYNNFVSVVILFFAYLLTFGVIGRAVASHYLESETQIPHRKTEIDTLSQEGTRSRCFHCGTSHTYPETAISSRGTVRCYTCGKEFGIASKRELLEKLGHDVNSDTTIDL